MKNVDHSYEQALIMHDNVHIHVIMNIIVTPSLQAEAYPALKYKYTNTNTKTITQIRIPTWLFAKCLQAEAYPTLNSKDNFQCYLLTITKS